MVQWKREYILWYKIASNAINDENIARKLSDDEIISFVSEENWMALPRKGETEKRHVYNRSDPNIYFSLNSESIGIGIVCNTISSVDKVLNLLTSYHSSERDTLVQALYSLDDDFHTGISRKIKEFHFLQPPEYEEVKSIQSNKMTNKFVMDALRVARSIRDEGLEWKRKEDLAQLPLAPHVELAYTRIPRSEKLFKRKILQLSPVYQACLGLKTVSQIEKDLMKKLNEQEDKLERLDKLKEEIDRYILLHQVKPQEKKRLYDEIRKTQNKIKELKKQLEEL